MNEPDDLVDWINEFYKMDEEQQAKSLGPLAGLIRRG